MVKVTIKADYADWFWAIQGTAHELDLDQPADLVGLLDEHLSAPGVPCGRVIQGKGWAIVPLKFLTIVEGDLASVPPDKASGYKFGTSGWSRI